MAKNCPECGTLYRIGDFFCPKCGKRLKKKEKEMEEKEVIVVHKKTNNLVLKIALGIVLGFILLFIGCGLLLSGVMEDVTEPTKSSPKVYVKDTYPELKEIFKEGSKYTDLQKDKIFDEQYKGKYVKWEGKVKEIDTAIRDDLRLDITMEKGLILDEYVIVYIDKSQYKQLLELNKEDKVFFSGRFDSYHTFLGVRFYFKDGKIIK